jgi:hypothetical protein
VPDFERNLAMSASPFSQRATAAVMRLVFLRAVAPPFLGSYQSRIILAEMKPTTGRFQLTASHLVMGMPFLEPVFSPALSCHLGYFAG